MPHPLVLVRHAEAAHHILEITGGWTDSELTETGLRQARLLGERLHVDLDGACAPVYCSGLRRGIQTAAEIAAAMGCGYEVLPGLIDMNNGDGAGKTHAEARLIALPARDPWIDSRPYHNAETWREFYQRMTEFADAFTRSQTGPAIIVTHHANLHVLIAWWLGLSVDSHTHFSLAPASLTVLTTSRRGERAVERLNDTAHLYADGLRERIQLG